MPSPSALRQRAAGGARSALAEAFTFVFPVDCAGCDAPDTPLCEACRAALSPRLIRGRLPGAARDVPVVSGVAFEGVAARVIRAVKEDGRTSLLRTLGPGVDAALAEFPRDAVVVPLPTSRASYRRRGFRVPDLLARSAGTPTLRLLRHVRQGRDQRGLSREQRTSNVAGSLQAVGAARGRRVIVLDDVVTTGASLAEAVRALREAGAEVIGAVTAAATPRRSG